MPETLADFTISQLFTRQAFGSTRLLAAPRLLKLHSKAKQGGPRGGEWACG